MSIYTSEDLREAEESESRRAAIQTHGDLGSSSPGNYARFGCRVNAYSIDDLFSAYRRSKFVYEQKAMRLRAHWPEILANWQSARLAGELIQYVLTYGDVRGDSWATVTSWRSTHRGWLAQHLVSTGGPTASRAVMLAGQVRIEGGWERSQQTWHRPSNRFAARAFGEMITHMPAGTASVIPSLYLQVPHGQLNAVCPRTSLVIAELDGGKCEELQDLARRCRGDLYVSAEELDSPDLLLDEVDQLYRLVGLRRYRRIWLASTKGGEPVAAAIAYRGPLGMNFSFLENRCDLLLSPGWPAEKAVDAIASLLSMARQTYAGLALDGLMVVCDARAKEAVCAVGGQVVQHYTQSIVLEAAFAPLFSYFDSLYPRRRGSNDHH